MSNAANSYATRHEQAAGLALGFLPRASSTSPASHSAGATVRRASTGAHRPLVENKCARVKSAAVSSRSEGAA